MIFLSAGETEGLIDWPSAIRVIVDAYSQDAGPGAAPGRVIAQEGGTWIRCMPSIPGPGPYMGTKQIVRSRAGTVSYLITLFGQKDSALTHIIDAHEITRLRTAATSVAALSLFGKLEDVKLAVLGWGVEAHTHLDALAATIPIAALSVYSPNERNREAFAAHATTKYRLPAKAAASAQSAVTRATLIVAAARSHDEQPILYADWIAPDAIVISVGSTVPSQRELDVGVIEHAKVIVADEPRELLHETGDMIAAAAKGIATAGKLFSLRQLIRKEVPAELLTAGGLRMFKSLGSAIQDIAFATLLAERAAERGLGTELPLALVEKGGQGRGDGP